MNKFNSLLTGDAVIVILFAALISNRYGDMVPVSNTGQIMTVFLMLFGSCYLSMPLSVSPFTF